MKIIILGNSITRHGPAPEIGWYGDYGMAASSSENDFAHILQNRAAGYEVIGINMAALERHYWEIEAYRDDPAVKGATDCNAEIIIFRIAENVNLTDISDKPKSLHDGFCDIINLFDPVGNKKVIMTTPFWNNDILVNTISDIAAERCYPLVALHDLGGEAINRADGLFEHIGVAMHPGDMGMKKIADRIWEVLKILI